MTTEPQPSSDDRIFTPGYILDLNKAVEILTKSTHETLYEVLTPTADGKSDWEREEDEIARSVQFEMTEAHFRATGLDQISFDNLVEPLNNTSPNIATVFVDPLSTIPNHPKWSTGAELILELYQDPNVFRGDFAGNRWQGSGAKWCRCQVEREDCPDRKGISSYGRPPSCAQCQEDLVPDETHYHLVQKTLTNRMCKECWGKGPLPEEDQTLKFRFLTDSNYR